MTPVFEHQAPSHCVQAYASAMGECIVCVVSSWSVPAANIFLWDRLRPAPGVPAAFLEDFMRAAPASRPAAEAGGIIARGAQKRLGRSTELASQYPVVYNAITLTVQGIVGAVVSFL